MRFARRRGSKSKDQEVPSPKARRLCPKAVPPDGIEPPSPRSLSVYDNQTRCIYAQRKKAQRYKRRWGRSATKLGRREGCPKALRFCTGPALARRDRFPGDTNVEVTESDFVALQFNLMLRRRSG
ncbi:hypothetical protein V8F20_008395 [Naviculisporaceae sp. PSN 640]